MYAEHQKTLTDYYTCKTMLVAWEFAKKLAAKLFVELGKLDADISAFGQKINDAIEETERLIAAQQKVNKGLEDMKGAVIEVSEEEQMASFEVDLKVDKIDMPNIARQLRESILPQTEFTNFGNLATSISVDAIKDAFDAFVAGAKEFADEVKTYIKDKWDAVTNWCKNTASAFSDGVKNVWNKMKEKVTAAVGAVKDTYNAIKGYAKDTLDNINKWQDDKQRDFWKFGMKYAVDKWGKDEVSSWLDEL
jgi:gas vesicle protein